MKNSILHSLYIKTSFKLHIIKKDNKIIVENTSNKREKIIFLKRVKPNRKKISLNSSIKTIKGEPCGVKLLSRRFHVFDRLDQSGEIQFNNVINKPFFIGVSFEPHSKYEISDLSYTYYDNNERIQDHFKKNVLVVTTGYPSENDKYNTSFVHTRVQEYLKNGISVDVAVVNDLYINKSIFY